MLNSTLTHLSRQTPRQTKLQKVFASFLEYFWMFVCNFYDFVQELAGSCRERVFYVYFTFKFKLVKYSWRLSQHTLANLRVQISPPCIINTCRWLAQKHVCFDCKLGQPINTYVFEDFSKILSTVVTKYVYTTQIWFNWICLHVLVFVLSKMAVSSFGSTFSRMLDWLFCTESTRQYVSSVGGLDMTVAEWSLVRYMVPK